MMNLRKLRYNISNCEIQDWVQLPTKPEMDAWRKENQKPFKINIVTNITVTLTKEKKYEYFGYVGMVRRKDVKD